MFLDLLKGVTSEAILYPLKNSLTCQAVFHIFRSCARLGLLCMDVSRFTCLLYLLLSFSVLLIFYLGGRMSGWEEIVSWSRQPAFATDTRIIANSNQRGGKIIEYISDFGRFCMQQNSIL